MKIIQVALGEQRDIQRAFSKWGEVVYIDCTEGDKLYFNKILLQAYRDFKPDIVFMQIQTSNHISTVTVRAMSGSFVANWTGDVKTPVPGWYYNIGRFINVTLFTNMDDVEHLRKRGIRADYLQIGFPEGIFKPEGTKKEAAEIIFMGGNYGSRFPLSDFRLTMVDFLYKEYGDRFACYGNGWGRSNGWVNQPEEAEIYRGSKIAINLSHFDYERYSSDRIFRIMGAGPLCLTHRYRGVEKDFGIGEHLDVWRDLNELKAKIDYYLNNEEKRKAVAGAGCRYVHENCTWTNRVEEFKRIYENYK